MTFASTTTAETTPAAETTVVETAGRLPLTYLIGSAIGWLLLSGVISLIANVQLLQPSFLAGCSFFTYGRTVAMAETAFLYGWVGNAGLGVVLWMLGRLSGEPLRAPNWALGGALFWNFALLIALIGIGIGYATGIAFFQMPAVTVPILLIAFGAMAVPGVLAWTGRRRDQMFASQWYGIAALFAFPWITIGAYIFIDAVPAQGVVQAIAGGWFQQTLWSFWMAPMALAGAYYVVARVTGRVLGAYDSALLGFWILVFIGGFTGGRHLIGGPVPAWISSIAIVATFVLLVHYIVVGLNLRGSFRGGAYSVKFIGVGLFAYLLGGLTDAITSIRGVARVTQFTWFDLAQSELALYGGISLLLFGALYFAIPRILDRPWSSGGLIRGHFVLSVIGLIVMVACLAVAGVHQGAQLNDPKIGFETMATDARPWLLGAAAGGGALFLGNLLFGVNLASTMAARVREDIRNLLGS